MYLVGGAVGFYCGNIKFLFEDMRVLKPTIMPSVPRLLNRIYEKEMANIMPWFFKRVMLNMALRSKENEIKKFGLSPISIIIQTYALPYTALVILEVLSEKTAFGTNWFSTLCKTIWAAV